jgi:DNA-binding CsgD family transcriptional regulator
MAREFEDRLIEAVSAAQIVNKVWPELSDMQTLVAAHLMEGLTKEEIALNMGVSAQSIAQTVNAMKTKFKHHEMG